MRTRSSAQRSLIASARVNHHLLVEVENVDRTYKDLSSLSGINWIDSAEWGESIDSPMGTATVTLRRAVTEPGDYSLAPTWGGSPLNRSNAGAYAPLLNPGRGIRISTAVTAAGVAPVSADWKLMFLGRIDTVQWNSDPVTVTARDVGAWLQDTAIEREIAYATDAPTALEQVMADLLADWPTIFGAPALYTPVSPAWVIHNTKLNDDKTVGTPQARKPLLEALQQDLALSIGWDCRYRFDAADAFRLTLYEPDRDKAIPDDTFAPSEYRDITALEISDADVKNKLDGIYYDADGMPHTRHAADPASQLAYGIRFMEIKLAPGDLIDSDDEMDRLLAAGNHDLSTPFATQEMETLYYWPVQLGDLYLFEANSDHYDDDQNLAVVGYRHRFANGEGITTIQCAGKVIGQYHAWLRRANTSGAVAVTPPAYIRRVSWTESADAKSAEYTVVLSASTDTLYVHFRTVPINVTGDPFDYSGSETVTESPQLLILRRPSDGSAVRFSIPHPTRNFKVAGRLVPRGAGPSFIEGINFPFGVDAAPQAVTTKLHAARIGAVGSFSVDVGFGPSDGPVGVQCFLDTLTTSTIIVSRTLTVPGTIDSSTDPILGALALPAGKDGIQIRVVVTDVFGQPYGSGPVLINRDPLPSGHVTVANFRASPEFTLDFDPGDTDAIRITTHSGKVKTFNTAALIALGSPVSWSATDSTDDLSSDPALVVDETRDEYKVEYQGGGTWLPIGSAITLHGQPSKPPTADIATDANADRSAMDVRVRPDTQVDEKLLVYFRDGSTNGALQWIACVGAGDPTPLKVVAGTQLGPANFFRRVDGVGSPTAKLSAIPLARDQVVKYGIMIEGVESGVQSPWLDVVLSLMEQPWLESTSAEYDIPSHSIRLRLKGGAHCVSVFGEASAASNFAAPLTASSALADGADVVLTFVLSGAQQGRTWYLGATPFNAASLGGLAGVRQVAEATVPAPYSYSARATESTTAGTGTITATVADAALVFDQTLKLQFYQTVNGVKTGPFAATSGPAGTTGAFVYTLTLDPKHNVKVEVLGNFADGSSAILDTFTFDSDKLANCVAAVPAFNNTTATYACLFDSDTVPGAANARFRINGGSWTTFVVAAALTGSFNVTRTSAVQTIDIQGLDADGNWGPSFTTQLGIYDAAPGQVTIAIDADGNALGTADGPANANSLRYSYSTSALPADATVAASGTLVSGSRVFGPTSLGTVTVNQTLYLTIVFFTGTSGTGTPLVSMHGIAPYQNKKTQKFDTIPGSAFVLRDPTISGITSDTGTGKLQASAGANPTKPQCVANLRLSNGLKVTGIDMYCVHNFTGGGTHRLSVSVDAASRSAGSFVNLGNAETDSASGAPQLVQVTGINHTVDSNNYGYIARALFVDTGNNATVLDLYAITIVYDQNNYSQGL